MRQFLSYGAFALVLATASVAATEPVSRVEISPPLAGIAGQPGAFGAQVRVLPGGNVVVVDPEFSAGDGVPLAAAGLVALFRPDGSLVSAMVGDHAGDRLGEGGITVLASGDFVVGSPYWNANRGAVTFGDADAGLPATISAANSLVAAEPESYVGYVGMVAALSNGHYVAASPAWGDGVSPFLGAVTWCDGDGSTVGLVSSQNSLVGTRAEDSVGTSLLALPNGDYVVGSPFRDDGDIVDAGAVNRCPGTGGCIGSVAANAALTGAHASDEVGTWLVALANGNYVVLSPRWHDANLDEVGAVTWRDANAGTAVASAGNSLVGGVAGDLVEATIVPLPNGHYVVAAPLWDNGAATDAGAIAWASGSAPASGAITTANALVGTRAGDGYSAWALPLANGHYVASFPSWDDGAVEDTGAVAWADGTRGATGAMSRDIALVGASAGDYTGFDVVALTNGHYVVATWFWDGDAGTGPLVDAGAATWRDGSGPAPGVVSAANSLVGSTSDDLAGSVRALPDGNYVAMTPAWDDGATVDAGAATWCAGNGGCTGGITRANSLIGTQSGDRVGNFVLPLSNGRYAVLSPDWNAGRGAVTWRSGAAAGSGEVTAANSLHGVSPGDAIGTDYAVLDDSHYLAGGYNWDGPQPDAGAWTLARSDGSTLGPVTADRPDTVTGGQQDSGSAVAWSHDAGTLAIGDMRAAVVTLLHDDRLFAGGFD